ncbi:MAG: diaminopimelate epimerase, partial [Oscillospiraceae bacterium]|nr:diaminopimelate epimerase [Oscillospiraceae bacterium]
DVDQYMDIILSHGIENPILIDKYVMGLEAEVDAICDGEEVLIPGIMAHVERAGVHSGDSIAMYPAKLSGRLTQALIDCTKKLALALNTRGLINIQYVIYNNEIYVIEANPRASRTIPYISKITGVPVVDLAVRAILGEKLRDMGYGTGLYPDSIYYAYKVPVFSFEKLADVDTHLGPEMKSTGEVLGVGRSSEEALYKGLLAAGYKIGQKGGVLLTVRDTDKPEIAEVARGFYELGFTLYASRGTAQVLDNSRLPVTIVDKIHEGSSDILDLLDSGKVQVVVSTSSRGRLPQRDSVRVRRKAVERSIACLTSIDTANALIDAIRSGYSEQNIDIVDINKLKRTKEKLHFIKMRASGNDYIYFDCFNQQIDSPEALSVHLSGRRRSIGSDGIVLMYPSDVADAKMRMFNADGTEGEVSGNAMKCVAKYLYESGRVHKINMRIETGGGVKQVMVYEHEGNVFSVQIDMGRPDFAPAHVPVRLDGDAILDRFTRFADDIAYPISCVSMGNPHCVIFVPDVDAIDLEWEGPIIEHSRLFPRRANVSFAQVRDPYTIKMRVWERGIGETLACGTGACAVVAAAVKLGHCPYGEEITLRLRGGEMTVRWNEQGITLTGEATKDFEGDIEV